MAPKSSPGESSASWVWRSRPGLEPHGTDLRGLHLPGWIRTSKRADHPLMPLSSRSEREHDQIRRHQPQLAPRVSPRPSLRFACPTAHEAGRSDLCRDCLSRLRNVFRLSRPLDAFLRFRPSSLVSCRWRSWASGLQRVSLGGSESHLPMTSALLAVARSGTRPGPLGYEDLRTREVRCSGPGFNPGSTARSAPDVFPPRYSLVGLGPTPSTPPSKLDVIASA
jgi:hypothetical protein